MTRHGFVEAQQLLANDRRAGVGDAEADVIAQRANIGHVVVQPFHLQQHCA
jgi:uncharacterized protein YcbX